MPKVKTIRSYALGSVILFLEILPFMLFVIAFWALVFGFYRTSLGALIIMTPAAWVSSKIVRRLSRK